MKIFTSKTQKIGEMGESASAVFLMKQGYKIVERNINNRYGEIDIVAKKKGIWHFFEVKTGKSGSVIDPGENFTRQKLNKFAVSVEYYCYTRNISDYRVGGIIVVLDEDGSLKSIEIIDVFQ